MTQIEAILNSRPLTPSSDHPNGLEALTPGHFIIGEALIAVPELDYEFVKTNHLTRYQHICQMTQHFWRRWSSDYLHQLQQRTKWRFPKATDQLVDSLVILKEDNTPPMRWPLGRVTQVHPGKDGLVRVVSVKISSGAVVKRNITKVCLFPK